MTNPSIASDLIERLVRRASIRRQIPGRKSVQEGAPDRIADLLEEASSALSQLTREVDELREALEAADERLCELTPNFPPDVGPDMRDAEEIEKTGAVVMQIREALSRSSGRVSDAQ